ncbi:uncharacterized protein LOC121390008 [Gigantopelta aegis]|uniref:uncharacterized protein LOC121390008 n=1 Tax=Gigantopelta aegis TaxID=1735272 RepID=UPI001B88DF1E|nr:uncharacterized protein LOC121390008 [Gigantopelta aegis]
MSLDQSFIVVKYGDDQEALFNPWCSTQTLVDWIRRKCECPKDVVIDLVDLDGQVKNLSGSSEEYANELVTGRETYILIHVEKADNGPNRYIPLLNNIEKINPELMIKLNNMARPSTRNKRERTKKMSRSGKPSKLESSLKRPTSTERRSKQPK